MDPPAALICWNGLLKGDEYSAVEHEPYSENFYQEAPITLDEIFTTRDDYKLYTVALVHFNSHLTHKDTWALETAAL